MPLFLYYAESWIAINIAIKVALNLEEPDRIPIHIINIDGNVADQIIGKPKRTAFNIFDDIEKEFNN